jgi:hypothetical protein
MSANALVVEALTGLHPETRNIMRAVLHPMLTEGSDALDTVAKATGRTPVQVACAYAVRQLNSVLADHYEAAEEAALAEADAAVAKAHHSRAQTREADGTFRSSLFTRADPASVKVPTLRFFGPADPPAFS